MFFLVSVQRGFKGDCLPVAVTFQQFLHLEIIVALQGCQQEPSPVQTVYIAFGHQACLAFEHLTLGYPIAKWSSQEFTLIAKDK